MRMQLKRLEVLAMPSRALVLRRSRGVLRQALSLVALVVAIAAVMPAAASASVLPQLGVDETAGNAAGSTSSLGVDMTFNATPGDGVKDVTVLLPPGLMLNEETNGGACLSTPAPTPACQIGTGTATVGGVSTPVQLYLVTPPAPSYLAGVELVAGSVTLIAPLSFSSSEQIGISPSLDVGEQIQFNGFPALPVISVLDLKLTGVTMPSSCQPAVLSLFADTQKDSVPVEVMQPFTVSNCLALPFQPSVTAAISRDTGSVSGNFQVTFTVPPGDSAVENLKLRLPPNLSINPSMDPCFEGLVCTVGKITETSPIMPTSQLTGTIVLAGTQRGPALNLSFPQPVSLQLDSVLFPNALSLSMLPQIPITSMVLSFSGNSLGGLFSVECYATTYGAVFYPWSGAPALVDNVNIGVGNCPRKTPARVGKPTARASVAGLAGGSPSLAIKAVKGKHAPSIKALSVALPSGLSFNATAALSAKTVSLAGASVASARVEHGALLVSFHHASANSTLTLRGPLLVESAGLRHDINSHTARSEHLSVTITDSAGRRTKLAISIA